MATSAEGCRRIVRLGLRVAFLSLLASTAFAFEEEGHRAIEAAAYARLIDSGYAAALAKLVRAKVLEGHIPETDPSRARARPVRPDTGSEEGLENVQGLRIATNFPDHSFDRQLQAYGQCFHFMAVGSDVSGAKGSAKGDFGVTIGLERDAYQRCVALADALLRGILFDPKDAKEHHLDAYVLIHMLEDSFSGAHVERSTDFKIMYLKPWRLETWLPYLVYPEGWKYGVSETHHGGLSESRDGEYLDPKCSEAPVVDPSCLSQRGRRAADAIAELLLLMARYTACDACGGFERDWNDYKKRHLAHAEPRYSAVLPDDQTDTGLRHEALFGSSNYLEEATPGTLGLGLATDFNVGQALWLDADVFALRNVLKRNSISFLDFLSLTVQLRLPLEDDLGERPFGAGADVGVRIPTGIIDDPDFTAYLSIRPLRIAGTAASIAPGIAQYSFEMGFGGVGLDFVVLNKVWVGFTAPRKLYRFSSWSNPEWESSFWTLKAGTVINGF